MRLVVDSNILLRCLLRFEGRVSELYLNPPEELELFGPERLVAELSLHRPKVVKYTGGSPARIAELEEMLMSHVTIVPNSRILAAHWEHAFNLVKDSDEDDDQFDAHSLHLNCPLWTGDKKLVNGLRRKSFKLLITSDELRKKLGA